MNEVNHPHDVFFKDTMSKLENARSFLKEYLPRDLLEIIDLKKLSLEKDSFIDEKLKEFFSDLLYKVQIQGQEGYVYILMEHKSTPAPQVALQLLEYMVRCWRAKADAKERLPVIIPLVLYHGEAKWNISQQFAALIAQHDARLSKYIPDFHYLLHDVSSCEEDNIRGITQLKVFLWLLKYIRNPILEIKLRQIFQIFSKDYDSKYMGTIVLYLYYGAELPIEKLIQISKESLSQGENDMVSTAQQLIQKGIQQGRQEGIQQGRQEGIQQERQQAIEQGLKAKFGPGGLKLMPKIQKIQNLETLKQVMDLLWKCPDLAMFQQDLATLLAEDK